MAYPAWSLIPFVLMLGSIAILPIIPATSHWWEKNSSQLLVALGLGIPTTVWMFFFAGSEPLVITVIDYFQFITLLFALYVVSGGIHLSGDIEATPRNNTIFLAIGGVLASFIGTTGAAMLLIRPLLATNKERIHKVHTVLFTIFIVANCGGLLTPLGDPPLFMGFLKGVPFIWTFNLFKEWIFVLVLLLLSYYSLDKMYYAMEPSTSVQRDRTEITPLRLKGSVSLIFFAAIILSVAFIPSVDAHEVAAGHAHGMQLIPWREIVMLSAAAASYFLGSKEVRFKDNLYTWPPILEVAILFIGIFATMAPALHFLEQIAPTLPLNTTTFFIFTGSLSAFLDNAPTYLTFFEMAKVLAGPDQVLVAGVPEHYLISISLGAVFCGAMTYIGNGPNFMVKAVAEGDGVKMPSFGKYFLDALLLLGPVLAAMALIFIVESPVAPIAGWVLTAGLVGISLMRIRKAQQQELARPGLNE
ncbi:MAG: sodium:proton antiporter [Actinomycetaceae bacterium]|nr:sodium:proton antiporter [Actinomycetaceae bacterium]